MAIWEGHSRTTCILQLSNKNTNHLACSSQLSSSQYPYFTFSCLVTRLFMTSQGLRRDKAYHSTMLPLEPNCALSGKSINTVACNITYCDDSVAVTDDGEPYLHIIRQHYREYLLFSFLCATIRSLIIELSRRYRGNPNAPGLRTVKNLWCSMPPSDDAWEDKSVSTFETTDGSVAKGLSENIEPENSDSRIPNPQKVERIWNWVDKGTYGSVEQGEKDGDISPYVTRKLSFSNNRELHEEGIRKQLHSIDISFPTSTSGQHEQTDSAEPREHSKGAGASRGTGGRGGSKQPAKDTANHRRKRKRTAPDESADEDVAEDANEDSDDDEGSDHDDEPAADDDRAPCRSYPCMTPDDRCKGSQSQFKNLEGLLHHMAQFHKDAQCCPICEEKLHFDRRNNRWTLKSLREKPQATLKSLNEFKFFFKWKDHAMRWHILRVHLRPYMCPVSNCRGGRFEKRQLKSHFKVHNGEPFDQKEIFKTHSNLKDPEFTEFKELVAKFHAGVPRDPDEPEGRRRPPTKAEMKGFLFWNCQKIYDYEDGTDRLKEVWLEQYPDRPRPAGNIPLAGHSDAGFLPRDIGSRVDDASLAALDSRPPPAAHGHAVSHNSEFVQPFGIAPHIFMARQQPPDYIRSFQQDFQSMVSANAPAPSIHPQADSYAPNVPAQFEGLPDQPNSIAPNAEEQDIRAPTKEHLKNVYKFTADNFKLLHSIPWQQRLELWELVVRFESVSASCDSIGMNISSDQARETRRTGLRAMIAKLLNHPSSQNLSHAIRQYQVEVNIDPDFAAFHPWPQQPPFSDGYLAEPADSGFNSGSS